MSHVKINRIVGAAVFAVTFTMYLLTLSPTVVFWDVGEFIAAARMLQVPHPPGSPLFLLCARIAMMIPFAADQAVRAHAFSALLSAFGIAFTYFVIIKLFRSFMEVPSAFAGKVVLYGAAAIGALSLAFISTYWDNSIEAEVYGASMFFFTIVLWLVMRWRDNADEPGSEKYILFVAYMIGLSLGVHLLSLLAIFPVLMILYFRRYEFSWRKFLFVFTPVALVIFFVVYPGIVKVLPGLMDGEWNGKKSEIYAIIPWVAIAGICYGAYAAYVKKQKMQFIAFAAMFFIFLGYTTYVSVLIRANANLPMNENDPSNLTRLTSYLGREQYGNAPLFFPRRYSQEPHQQGIYTNYSSDTDFMIRYQLNHMFFRYVGWNYVGAEGDVQDSGVSWKDTWGIPLLIGLFGLYHQFRKDWKMGLVFAVMFIILGPVLALYQNQQEPQPRERDYFYVGAYLCMSIWISYGVLGLYELLQSALKNSRLQEAGAYALVGLCLVAVPANLVRVNHHAHDRSGDFVAWDYSYNMLQTCEKDALLFTNGDNDTFPLWYLQDVEGIRRDVRIVNLSLVNTPWYIQQMKKTPYYTDALAVPMTLSEKGIENIQPIPWKIQKVILPVPMEAYQRYGVTDTMEIHKGKIEFSMNPTLRYGKVTAIRAQDIMVRSIVEANQWKRPIYFAVTCAPDSRIGLDEYLWFHGLAYRLEPRKVNREEAAINSKVLEENLYNEPVGFSKTPQYGYKFRSINNPNVFFDENVTRLMVNLRFAFVKLANYYANIENNFDRAAKILDRMEFLIPRSKIEMGWELTSDLSQFYRRIGKEQKADSLMNEVEPELLKMIDQGQYNLQSYYNPFRVLLDLYEARKDYAKNLELLRTLQTMYPQDPSLKARMAILQAQIKGGSVDSMTRLDTAVSK